MSYDAALHAAQIADGIATSDRPDEERPEPTCPRCGHEIDPTTCCCGDAIDGRAHDNHYPVPMGCRCHEMPLDLGGEG